MMAEVQEGTFVPEAEISETAPVVTQTQRTVQISAEVAENIEVVIEDGEVVVIQEEFTENTGGETFQNQRETPSDTQTLETVTQTESPTRTFETAVMEEIPVEQVEFAESQIQERQAIQTEALRQAASPTPVNTADVIEQIMNQVKIVVSSGAQFTEMRLTLRPESLGDIVLRVITQNGIVLAQFEAENQRVKEALESSFNHLRDALTDAGIRFGELSVSVRQNEEERLNQFEQGRSRSRRRMETIGAAEAEEEKPISFHEGVVDVVA
jgi:flagellar hook-length control protein FliK